MHVTKASFNVRVLHYPYSILRFNQVYSKLVKGFPYVRAAHAGLKSLYTG